MLNLDYSNLLEIVKPYKKTGRTESAAFLHWFLVNKEQEFTIFFKISFVILISKLIRKSQ